MSTARGRGQAPAPRPGFEGRRRRAAASTGLGRASLQPLFLPLFQPFFLPFLLPFLLLAASAWIDPEWLGAALEGDLFGPAIGVSGLLMHILSVYAVAVLGFDAGARWARRPAAVPPARPEGADGSAWRLASAILPALLGWLIVALVDLPGAFGWLSATFVLAAVLDRLSPTGGGPAASEPLPRLGPAMLVAAACLGTAALAG